MQLPNFVSNSLMDGSDEEALVHTAATLFGGTFFDHSVYVHNIHLTTIVSAGLETVRDSDHHITLCQPNIVCKERINAAFFHFSDDPLS